jgi:uncharacterized membrane protein YuzA (DUF378 family)
MKVLDVLMILIVFIGAINWGLVGLFNFNLVTFLFGTIPWLVTTVYVIVGICGLVMLYTRFIAKV